MVNNCTKSYSQKVLNNRWIITAAHCCSQYREENITAGITGGNINFDNVWMTFGEHTEYEYESSGHSLKQEPSLNKLYFD